MLGSANFKKLRIADCNWINNAQIHLYIVAAFDFKNSIQSQITIGRVAGTVELGGLEAPPNYARAELLLRHAKQLLPGLSSEGMTQWMGFRPSLPDSLPVLGRVPGRDNAYLNFGHGHLGLTMAAVSGRHIAALAAGREAEIDLTPYRPDRF